VRPTKKWNVPVRTKAVGLDDDESDDGTNASGTSWRDIDCTSSKRLCHQYGYCFDVCVAKACSLDEFNLEELAEDCWFVTKKVNEMSPSEKRNVLYWWFMVNVDHVCGKDKHHCPPKCLIKAIRERYPNPPGVPYVDFRRKNRKRRR